MENMELKRRGKAIERYIKKLEESHAHSEEIESEPGVTLRPGLPKSKIEMVAAQLLREYLSIIREQSDLSQLSLRRAKIRAQIEKTAATSGVSYIQLVTRCLDFLWFGREIPEAKYLFEEVFYEDFAEHKETEILIPFYTMIFEGIEDIPFTASLESLSKFSKAIKGDIDDVVYQYNILDFDKRFPLKRIRQIYSHSEANPLLIIGETGTSKGLLAKAMHKMSTRRRKDHTPMNCAAFPETMLESELFGFERGAFTDARERKKGLFEIANGGTIFLDEIGKMPQRLQAKLLTVIESQEFYRIGGKRPIKVDLRFIAAAQPGNIENDDILPDLKFRLGFPDVIKMPNLRERLSEIPEVIIDNSLKRNLRKMNLKEEMFVNEDAFAMLVNHEYPGNFRELENILRGAALSAIVDKRNEILPGDLQVFMEKNSIYQNKVQALGKEFRDSLGDIKLSDIIDYADRAAAEIVEKKVRTTLSRGKDLKSVLRDEGLPEKKYQNFLKKVNRITKKSLKELSQAEASGLS
jgi:transcriptional regulator with AAA-type ATPase domain